MNQIYLNDQPVTPEQYIQAVQDPTVVVIAEGHLRFRTFTKEQAFSNPSIEALIRLNGGDPDTIQGNAEEIVEEEPKAFSVLLNDGVGTQDSTGDSPEVITPEGEGE